MKILCCVEMFLAITICHQIGHGRRLMPRIKTNSTLKYSKFAYSVFSVRQFTTDNSTLVFQFKTLKKHGMLFYMDDEGANFIDAFLLRGQLRIRLTIGSCKGKQFINGSFTDLEWHRIILKRTPETVLLTVDNRNASTFKICNRVGETSFKKLYVSSFPFEEWLQPIKWMFRDSWELSLKHGGFEGCIKTPKYSVGVKRFRRARLLKSERTLPGCRNACKDKSITGKCYNGGKCVNKVVRRECDCKGTGYYGSNCSQVAMEDSMAGLRFSGQFRPGTEGGNFAEFSGWPMVETSQLQLYFKTTALKLALLAYQDTGVDDRSGHKGYLEVSLLANGHARLKVVGDTCSPFQVQIPRSFSDGSWHKLTISRKDLQLNFSVGNISAPSINCVQAPKLAGPTGKAKKSLFIGGIPVLDSQGNPTFGKWSLTGLPSKVTGENSWFKGCVALLRYSSASKPFENAKLQSSLHVLGNCSGEPCSRNQHICLHNGTCVDLITMTECVCETTGYHGRYCEQSGSIEPTATIAANSTLATAGPLCTVPFKSEPSNNKNNNNNGKSNGNNGSPAANRKEDFHGSSSLASFCGWCLLFSATTVSLQIVA